MGKSKAKSALKETLVEDDEDNIPVPTKSLGWSSKFGDLVDEDVGGKVSSSESSSDNEEPFRKTAPPPTKKPPSKTQPTQTKEVDTKSKPAAKKGKGKKKGGNDEDEIEKLLEDLEKMDAEKSRGKKKKLGPNEPKDNFPSTVLLSTESAVPLNDSDELAGKMEHLNVHDDSDHGQVTVKPSQPKRGAVLKKIPAPEHSGVTGDGNDDPVPTSRNGAAEIPSKIKAKQCLAGINGQSLTGDGTKTLVTHGRSDDADSDAEVTIHIKTAAEKRAEKKEREKRKAAQKPKSATSSAASAAPAGDIMKTPIQSVPVAESAVIQADQEDTAEKNQVDQEPKTSKSKKKETTDDSKKPKKLSKGIVMMKEAIERRKREEEMLREAEEARIKAEEEAENARLEKLRLAKERELLQKQKEKERRQRLKAEGKLLTKAQKETKARAELMLQHLREQGVEVPSKEQQPKKVNYGSRPKKKGPKEGGDTVQITPESTTSSPDGALTSPSVGATQVDSGLGALSEAKDGVLPSTKEEIPESWDASDARGLQVSEMWETVGSSEEREEESMIKLPQQGAGGKLQSEPVKSSAEVSGVSHSENNKEDRADSDSQRSVSESSESSSMEDSEGGEEEEDKEKLTPERRKELAKEKIAARRTANEAKRTIDKLRAPVICVLGHVDTGKTKILDKLRNTHVQDGEAGGITQQIGATNMPVDAIMDWTRHIPSFTQMPLKLPGLLVIDTPGHESFSNLRSRGSNLCDMAILVVDIMHGLEPQTIESINLLKKKSTPFVVALNKIDRLFEWKPSAKTPVEETIKKQKRNTKLEFEDRLRLVITQFSEQGLNAALFYENPDDRTYISLVPTSALTADGMGDLIALLCRLTQTKIAKRLAYSPELEATVMEVKSIPGLGTTIDVILVNGKLHEGAHIVLAGLEGPVCTQIRSLMTPQPLRELRVKSHYIQHKDIEAAVGVKIAARDLERAIAGSPLLVAENDDEVEVLKEEVQSVVEAALKSIKVADRGVYVQASTLGSLEALLEFLNTSKISYSGVNIGPVHRKDVIKASVMLEHEPMYAVILAFDVKVEPEAQQLADKEGLTIFTADIIYHLFDKFTAYTENYKAKKREEFKNIAVYPCKLRILPLHIFNSRDPVVVGVNIEAGSLHLGTPVVALNKEMCNIGIVTGIEANHKTLDKALKGQEVCVKIENIPGETPKLYGRHFTHEDFLVSKISRDSIDALKNYFREDMQKSDWQLIIELKKVFGIL